MERPSDSGCVTVIGGSGFLGSAIVETLVAEGRAVRIACRHPDQALPQLKQITGVTAVYADVRDETSVALAIEGCDAVVNAVGLYVETASESFEAVHELGAANVAHQASASGVDRLVHISGIGADIYSRSAYVRARGKGDLMVRDIFPGATILRPSALFGTGDAFVNTLAGIARATPVLPLFGKGDTKLQPVHVNDVAAATVAALSVADAPGQTYELGGPRVYSYHALIELVLAQAGLKRVLLPVPFAAWDLLARLSSLLARPPVTEAQVTLMRQDNVVGATAGTLQDLGIDPTPLEDVLPRYRFHG